MESIGSQYFIDTMVPELNIQHKVISVMELLQIDIFERFVAANTPKKYQTPLNLLFLDGFFFGFMQIRSLSSEISFPQEHRCAGGSPSSNPRTLVNYQSTWRNASRIHDHNRKWKLKRSCIQTVERRMDDFFQFRFNLEYQNDGNAYLHWLDSHKVTSLSYFVSCGIRRRQRWTVW